MQRLLYPLIASALVTIVPFLLSFENGQDIIRGLFCYEIFAILLLTAYVKNQLSKHPLKSKKGILWLSTLTLLIITINIIAWVDLQNLLAIKRQNTNWHGILPFATCGLAIFMIWKIKSFGFNTICFILFVTLIVHLAALNQYAAQPLAQFPTIDYLDRIAPKPIQRTDIAKEYKENYIIIDSASISKNFIDTTKNNVLILIESWGVPLDINRFKRQLINYEKCAITIGIHKRMYSRTSTAEREDLIFERHLNSAGLKDTTYLPEILATKGYSTTFLFGGDSLEHNRFKYVPNIGFNHIIYEHKQNDHSMSLKIDSILTDTIEKKFIAWTTRDTKFPFPEFSSIYNNDPNAIDSAYTKHLTQTLGTIASLAQKHPETRFIIQGDHNPILSPIKFQERFYKRWVPFVILN